MEMDINKIAVGVVTDLTKTTVKSIFSYLPGKIISKYEVYFRNFEDYLEKTHKVCSIVRTIISKDRPTSIEDIYVKGRYKCGKEIIGDDELAQKIRDGQRVIVSGFGGIGKTIFCKYLWKSLYDNPIGKVPIYFELRNINDITTQNLSTYIRLSLTVADRPVPEAIFSEMMANGRFVFIFDGFDEVPERFRLDIQAQILELAARYEGCGFVVSSRADDRFSSWLEFHTYHANEFDKEQSRLVIQKIEFDREIKKEFMSEILEKRYEDYRTFFSTPLLTLMMLMTYLQIRYVPDSRHVFYRYAFQTLYTLHDASKQGFQRKRFIEMGESDFINVFSLFCLVSYADMEHSFTRSEIINYINKVKSRSRVDYDPELFLKECVESVNLIYKDGDNYSFIHRSFQEYFCAYAVTHYFPDKISEVIERIPVQRADSVFPMMYSINPEIMAKMYVIPVYKGLQKDIIAATKKTDPMDIISLFANKIDIFFNSDSRQISYGYRIDYKERLHHFVESIVCTFKNDVPSEMNRQFVGHSELRALVTALRSLIPKSRGKKSIVFYHATFDFAKKRLSLSAGSNRFSEDGDELLKDMNAQETSLVNMRYFSVLSQNYKSHVVFVKKKCDEMVRINNEVNKSGDDILSL
ncbi:NACHT domain-containing protein [Agrobacterium sp. P15N1-A]|uniref:NACHT domain-containing protein n=1 Tax=Agrobacterium sp. P15N1-A TaxID=3342820 RepID=UPI0037D7BB9C